MSDQMKTEGKSKQGDSFQSEAGPIDPKELARLRKQLPRHYKNAIDYLDDNYAYFLTHILNMGKPNYSMAIPTACVALTTKDQQVEDFRYLFNPAFAMSLSAEEFAFVMAHETLHILHNHLAPHFREDPFDFPKAVNVAMDAILNDGLSNEGFQVPTSAVLGPAILGYDCSQLTVREVYDALIAKYPPQPCPICEGKGSISPDQQQGQGQTDPNCPQHGDQSEQNEGESQDGQDGQDGAEGQDGQQDGQDGAEGQDGQQDGDGQGDQPGDDHQHGDSGQACTCPGNQPGEGDGQGDGDGEGEGQDGQQGGDGQGQGQGGQGGGGHDHGDSDIPCPGCNGDFWNNISAGEGAGSIDDHSWMDQMTDEQREAVEKIIDKMRENGMLPDEIEQARQGNSGEDQDSYSKMAGVGQGAERQFCEQHGVSMKWAELLKIINPDVFKKKGPPLRHTFARSPRRMSAFVGETNLPTYAKDERRPRGEQPSIVMALDTSGSVRQDDVDCFVTLARSIPKNKINLYTCTFTSEYMPLDLDDPHFVTGGTDFSAIERYIHDHVIDDLGHYPKAVVVITDGYASFYSDRPEDKHLTGWHWMLCHGYTPEDFEASVIPDSGSYHNLDDYMADRR